MTLELYYTNTDGDLVLASNRVRVGITELNLQAVEMAVGESQIVVDDPDGDFYTPGHRPLYLLETEAVDDPFMGIIGVAWTWTRTVRRGPYRTGPGREVVITCKDMNTLATMRVQKGGDADRDEESDVDRITWLIGTPEVVGGFGSNGFTIEDTEFFFDDTEVTMGATSYDAQDSAGVFNDALQDSSKNAYLFNSPIDGQPIRVGLWYGHTDRAEFTSAHAVSNDPDDVSPETLDAAWMSDPDVDDYTALTFAPSVDAELERDPSRQVTGALVQWDGGSTYVSQDDPAPSLTHRDMVFAAELVKSEAQATRRGEALLGRLEDEDDAITCSVIVPAALVNGFHQGHRVPVRFTHMSPEGYAGDPVYMRLAGRTVRQLEDKRLYEIAMDLRGESPPGPVLPGPTPPTYDASIFARLSNVSGPYPLPSGDLHWNGIPQLPWEATSPEFDYVETGKTGHRWSGIQLTADGTLQSVVMIASCIGVALGANEPYTVTFELMVNGSAIATVSQEVFVAGASNLFTWRPRLEARDVDVSNGDIISGRLSCLPVKMEMFRSPHGIDPGVLIIRGGSF